MWVSRYWIGGLITLGLIDGINYLLSKHGNSERWTNSERVWIFILWPIMAVVFVGVYILSWFNRNNSNNGE